MWFIGTVCKFYIEWFLGAHEAQLGLAHFEAWLEPCGARSYLASACLCCVYVCGCVNVMSTGLVYWVKGMIMLCCVVYSCTHTLCFIFFAILVLTMPDTQHFPIGHNIA